MFVGVFFVPVTYHAGLQLVICKKGMLLKTGSLKCLNDHKYSIVSTKIQETDNANESSEPLQMLSPP